ncbi:MAG: hypothetical protein KDK23_15570 [Leptospiraceae bacterium]|nr:hypothetical protein [Leptospiraceae bacterium]
MQDFEYPLKASDLEFQARILLPDGAELQERNGAFVCTYALDGLALMRIHCSDNGLFTFLGTMQALPGKVRKDELGAELLQMLDEDSAASMSRLSESVLKSEQSLKCIIMEVRPSEQEDSEDYYLARVFAAGMPPLLLIDAGNYRIPTRSGIPLGISEDLEQPLQSLEWDRGGTLHMHTEIAGALNLESLHQSLVECNLEQYGEAIHVRLQA